jgi:hypothetical protein
VAPAFFHASGSAFVVPNLYHALKPDVSFLEGIHPHLYGNISGFDLSGDTLPVVPFYEMFRIISGLVIRVWYIVLLLRNVAQV